MNTINIAGIDELGILKNRLSNKQKVKSMTTCGFVSCKANMENLLYDNDVLDCINTSFPPVSTFVSKLNGADVLFFDVNPKKASIIIDYNFSTMVLPDAKLVVFRFDSKENLVKVALQDLVKCFPNAVIAGFIFKTNGIKGFTNFLNTPNFYKLLNGESPKGDSQQDLEKAKKNRIKKLLSSGEFKSLCKGDVSSNYFYSSAVNENFYFSINSSEIDNYSSLSKAIQREITKNSDSSKLANIKNSAIFTGTVMFDAFESFVDDDDLQYNVANVKNAHRFIYDQFKKKDVDQTFPGYFLPIQSLTGVRPGDLMLSVDFDDKSENFRIVSSVGNDGKVDVVGLNNGQIVSKSLNIKNLSKGTSSSEYVKELSYEVRCYEEKKMSVCGVSNGATYTLVYIAGKKISDANVEQLGIEAVRDSSGMLFYFARPLLLNHLFDEWEDAPSKPVSMDENKTVSPNQEKELNKFLKECEKTINSYKIIKYIRETALTNYNEDMNSLGLFENAGYVYSDKSYWREIQKRINNFSESVNFSQDEKYAMYQEYKADKKSYSVMKEIHKKVFGVDYDKDKIEAANKAFFMYLTMYRLRLIREDIDKLVKSIISDAEFNRNSMSIASAITGYYDIDFKEEYTNSIAIQEHNKLLDLFCNIFGDVNKDDYRSLSSDQLIKVITGYTKSFEFLDDLLPNIENYASYHSIEAYGYDFAIIIKYEKEFFKEACYKGEVLKDILVFLIGCLTGPLASKIAGKAATSGRVLLTQAGLDAGTSVLLDTMNLLYKSGVSYKIDYKSEIAKIFVNAILGFGTSFIVGGLMNKCTKTLSEYMKKRKTQSLLSEFFNNLSTKNKNSLSSFIKELDQSGKHELSLINKYIELADREFKEFTKKFKSLEKDFSFNKQLNEKLDYIFSDEYLMVSNKEIKFLIGDKRNYNVVDLFKDKNTLKELESEIRKNLSGTEFKNYSILGPKEKMAFVIQKKSVELKNHMKACEKAIQGAQDSQIELKKLLEEFNTNRAKEVETKMREILGDPNFKLNLPMDVEALKKAIDKKYNDVAHNVSQNIKDVVSEIEDANRIANNEITISFLESVKMEREAIDNMLDEHSFLLGMFGSLFSTYLCSALSSKTSSLFDKSDENWLDRPVEDVISENINMIQMSSIDEEYRNRLKKECAGFNLKTAQQQNMVSALDDNPFTVYVESETKMIIIDKFVDKYETCEKIKMAEYSEEVKNLAKKILTEQNVPYDLDYTEYKHLKMVCFTRLVNNLIEEKKFNVELKQLKDKETEMREKYPELNKLLNGVKR